MMRINTVLLCAACVVMPAHLVIEAQTNAAAIEAETLQHFQALLRLDTSSPPGNEIRAVEYLKQVFEKDGIPNQVFAKDPKRPNLVARIKGNGKKRPILSWATPTSSPSTRRSGRIRRLAPCATAATSTAAARSTTRTTWSPALMLMLMLKRGNVPLDRDVIFLAESGEEGAPEVGAQFMVDKHLDAINAEFCLAEGGGVVRTGGQVVQANIGTTEKEPRAVELIARGPAGHGSVPSRNNAVTQLSAAVGKVAAWSPPLRVNETTGAYFSRWRRCRRPRSAQMYRDVLNPDPEGLEGRPRTGCSTTSRSTGRCCTPRSCRPSSTAATATTSFRRRPRRRSTSACIPTRISRRSSTGSQGDQRPERRGALGDAIAIGRPAARRSTPRRSR